MVDQLLDVLNVTLIIKMALIVVGTTQWIKSLVQKIKIPTWVWALFMALLAVGVVFAETYQPIINVILLVVCVSQLGYEVILQNIKKIVSKFVDEKPSRY